MKKPYEKPTLTAQGALDEVTAQPISWMEPPKHTPPGGGGGGGGHDDDKSDDDNN